MNTADWPTIDWSRYEAELRAVAWHAQQPVEKVGTELRFGLMVVTQVKHATLPRELQAALDPDRLDFVQVAGFARWRFRPSQTGIPEPWHAVPIGGWFSLSAFASRKATLDPTTATDMLRVVNHTYDHELFSSMLRGLEKRLSQPIPPPLHDAATALATRLQSHRYVRERQKAARLLALLRPVGLGIDPEDCWGKHAVQLLQAEEATHTQWTVFWSFAATSASRPADRWISRLHELFLALPSATRMNRLNAIIHCVALARKDQPGRSDLTGNNIKRLVGVVWLVTLEPDFCDSLIRLVTEGYATGKGGVWLEAPAKAAIRALDREPTGAGLAALNQLKTHISHPRGARAIGDLLRIAAETGRTNPALPNDDSIAPPLQVANDQGGADLWTEEESENHETTWQAKRKVSVKRVEEQLRLRGWVTGPRTERYKTFPQHGVEAEWHWYCAGKARGGSDNSYIPHKTWWTRGVRFYATTPNDGQALGHDDNVLYPLPLKRVPIAVARAVLDDLEAVIGLTTVVKSPPAIPAKVSNSPATFAEVRQSRYRASDADDAAQLIAWLGWDQDCVVGGSMAWVAGRLRNYAISLYSPTIVGRSNAQLALQNGVVPLDDIPLPYVRQYSLTAFLAVVNYLFHDHLITDPAVLRALRL